MRPNQLMKLGIPAGEPLRLVLAAMQDLSATGVTGRRLRGLMDQLIAEPSGLLDHPQLSGAAKALLEAPVYKERSEPAPSRIWGDDFEAGALEQLEDACSLPVSVAAALMPMPESSPR